MRMKDVNLYLEIDGLAIDEDGNESSAGLKVKLGSLPDDKYEEAMEQMKNADPDLKQILGMIGLEDYHARVITEEEYYEKYEDGE